MKFLETKSLITLSMSLERSFVVDDTEHLQGNIWTVRHIATKVSQRKCNFENLTVPYRAFADKDLVDRYYVIRQIRADELGVEQVLLRSCQLFHHIEGVLGLLRVIVRLPLIRGLHDRNQLSHVDLS
jgi:hypothetical protein